MKNLIRLLGLICLLVLVPCVYGADLTGTLTGTWKGSFDFQGTDVPVELHFAASGSALTGTVTRTNAPAAEIHEGKVDGDAVSFWINADYEGSAYKVVFKGKATASQIDFVLGTEDGSWGSSMTAKKAEAAPANSSAPDANGTWKGSFDFQGTSVPLVFHFKATAGLVTGTVEGLPSGIAQIKDGKADGDLISFSLMTDYQGSPVKLVFRGKISATDIKFTFGTEEGSWGTELTAGKV
ncbi:MAG: hypothetical protein P4K83_00910 [Terracidiphilus sp.]|nr:hypothetical protein [Terracidiphilus sp.]